LYKLGFIEFSEPFLRLRHQGMILGDDNRKMSKSKGNVVNPDEVIEAWGADALRVYGMFLGPFDQRIAWSTAGIEGVRKFLNRVWSLVPQSKAVETDRAIHVLIKKVTDDIEKTHFNTAISSFMEFTNLAVKKGITLKTLKLLIILLAPFTPHLAEEINCKLGSKRSIFKQNWPKFDLKKIKPKKVIIAIQINGKLRGTIEIKTNVSASTVANAALKLDAVKKYISNPDKVKYHYVDGRVINFVIKNG